MCTGLEWIPYAIGATASVAGTAMSVQAQREQADQADAMTTRQQQQSQLDAQYAASEAALQAKSIRKASERQRAEARASLAGSGVVVGEGTAEQIDRQIGTDAEQDALMAMYDGKTRSQQIQAGGDINAWQGRNAASAARWGAAGSALSGAASLAGGWQSYRRGRA